MAKVRVADGDMIRVRSRKGQPCKVRIVPDIKEGMIFMLTV